jgi:hypothetical protein
MRASAGGLADRTYDLQYFPLRKSLVVKPNSCGKTNQKAHLSMDSLIGTPDRIRTYDLRLRKPTLYPAELRVLVSNETKLRFFSSHRAPK